MTQASGEMENMPPVAVFLFFFLHGYFLGAFLNLLMLTAAASEQDGH